MLKSVFVLLSFVTLMSGSVALAGLAEDFEALKPIPRDYTDAGSICEEVARLRVADQYPAPQYKVETGIAYANATRTIGELDVIVFDLNTNKVIKLGEVKCWKDAAGGLRKAKDQRARFLQNVRSSIPLRFMSTSNHQAYSHDQFRYVNDFISIAQKGTTAVGYDMELEYTLNEFQTLRLKMIQCQKQGECAKP